MADLRPLVMTPLSRAERDRDTDFEPYLCCCRRMAASVAQTGGRDGTRTGLEAGSLMGR
jgi:hypothetical protein